VYDYQELNGESMYERTGRYYAFFGPSAQVSTEESRFLEHWTVGRRRALDIGAGLCGPATLLARLGLDVLAVEPSSELAALAMDRLNRGDDTERSITLIEGPVESVTEPFAADVILMRSVLMLLDDDQRHIALDAARRHAAPGARLICDVRTAALAWADEKEKLEERQLGHTCYRRSTRYSRDSSGSTRVEWLVEAQRFGRTREIARETFEVRADTEQGLRRLLQRYGFEVRQLYGAYDLERPFEAGNPQIVAVAELAPTAATDPPPGPGTG
jgi:SAM-dependent methyltransferase